MTKSAASGMTVTILDCVAYTDASGMPCAITVGRLLFACNLVGTVRVRLVGENSYVSRRERLIATSMAERAYARLLDGMSPEWMAANRAMYAAASS